MTTSQVEPDVQCVAVTICPSAFKTAPSAVRSEGTEEIYIHPAVKGQSSMHIMAESVAASKMSSGTQ